MILVEHFSGQFLGVSSKYAHLDHTLSIGIRSLSFKKVISVCFCVCAICMCMCVNVFMYMYVCLCGYMYVGVYMSICVSACVLNGKNYLII